MDATQKCTCCQKELPLTAYYRNKVKRAGGPQIVIRSRCIPCYTISVRKWQKKNKKSHKQSHKKWIKKKLATDPIWTAKYKAKQAKWHREHWITHPEWADKVKARNRQKHAEKKALREAAAARENATLPTNMSQAQNATETKGESNEKIPNQKE